MPTSFVSWHWSTLGPLGFNFPNMAQRHALPQKRLHIKYTCFRIAFSSPVQKLVQRGSWVALFGCLEVTHTGPLSTHTEPKSAVVRLMVSHGWSIRSPTKDPPQGEKVNHEPPHKVRGLLWGDGVKSVRHQR